MQNEITESAGLGKSHEKSSQGLVSDEVFAPFDSSSIRSRLADGSLNLDCLNAREFFVMTRRHGLDGEAPQSYMDIGEHLELSKEAIRKDVLRGTRKLREAFQGDRH